jgi:hypothetical protein
MYVVTWSIVKKIEIIGDPLILFTLTGRLRKKTVTTLLIDIISHILSFEITIGKIVLAGRN